MELLHSLYLQHPIICTDTRTISDGCLFFALKGDNFNGNDFAEQALSSGAAYAIVDETPAVPNKRLIIVEDVLSTLQELATFHRDQLTIPVIGLTGSNGKTTTKELIAAVLMTKYTVFATKGNLNNHIGVPLSILSIQKDTEIAVIEMGANHVGEIEMLCRIAKPSHGLITNIGLAHLEGFGGYEGVKKGKSELYAFLQQSGGVAFVNNSNAVLMELSEKARLEQIIFYGSKSPESLVNGELSHSESLISVKWASDKDTYNSQLNITGAYNLENVLSAICLGRYFKVTDAQIHQGLESYVAVNNRSQITKTATNSVICDFYNANPSSMMAAIDNLSAVAANSKAAILGDMFEMGDETDKTHSEVAEKALAAGFNNLLFIGAYFFALKGLGGALFFKTPAEAKDYLEQHPISESTVLLKGSRGMALEQLLPLL